MPTNQPKSLPRGIRNRNPFNIRKTADRWQGLFPDQLDPSFCTFDNPVYGIRAGMMILLKYQDKYGLNTIRSILHRFAPPSENDTGSYAFDVARRMGVGMDDRLDLRRYATAMAMAGAIIAHECAGYKYPDEVLAQGLAMAGIKPTK